MFVGVDLGGTKIEAVALDKGGAEHARIRVPTPLGSYPETIAALAALVRRVGAEAGCGDPSVIGVGIPGSPSPATGLIRNANSTWINGMPLQRDLESALGCQVILANDANCLAASEVTDGAAAGAACVFAVILGTGVGGGLAVNGRVVMGRNAIAGEWGHNPLPWPDRHEREGEPCFCGKRGCIETWLSGPALERQHLARTGEARTARQIADQAAGGDSAARTTLETHGTRLAKSLAAVINVVDPDVVVFGGGLSNIPYILDRARAELPAFVFSDVCATEFRVSRWGDSSGVRGAARLAEAWPGA
jgi:fructokinase